jgi:hypothetical protein
MNSVSPSSKNYVTLAPLALALSKIFPERKVNFESCFWLLLYRYQLKCVLFVQNFLTLKASKMVYNSPMCSIVNIEPSALTQSTWSRTPLWLSLWSFTPG